MLNPVLESMAGVDEGVRGPNDRMGGHDWCIAGVLVGRCPAGMGLETSRQKSLPHAAAPPNLKTCVLSRRAKILYPVGERATCGPCGGNPSVEMSVVTVTSSNANYLDDTKTSEPPDIDSQQFDLVLLHPFQNSFPGFHPRIEMQQFWPIRYFTSWW